MAHIRETTLRNGSPSYIVKYKDQGRSRQKAFRNRRAAERFKTRVEAQIAEKGSAEGLYVRKETVADLVEKVQARNERLLKERTWSSYQHLYGSRVLPRFGKRKIATITSQEIEAYLEELSASGLAPGTVRHVHVALSKVFKYATKHKIIPGNPCTDIDLPSSRKQHGVFLLPSEVDAVAAALPEPYDLLVRFTASTGLRAAEITGLRVGDVDLRTGEIHVQRTLQRFNGEWLDGTPKSERSTRAVPILDRDLLRDLKVFLLQHPHSSDEEALFWPGRKPGGRHELDHSRPFHQGSFRGWYWRPALVRAGLLGSLVPQTDGTLAVGCCDREFVTREEAARHIARHVRGGPRFHDLRHTAASSWIAAGIDIYKVSRWLGHSTIAITFDIYGHLLPRDYSEDADRYAAWGQAKTS